MESARLQREQTRSEPVRGRAQKVRAPVTTVASRPLSLSDAHSPALHLGNASGSSHSPWPRALQAKLTVNEPGDQYEQEADGVAEQVMRMPDPAIVLQRKCGCGGSTASGESCEECASHAPQLQRHSTPAGASSGATAPPVVHDVLRSPGQPLDTSTRVFMEPRFGHTFDQVRVRTDERAAESARAVNALAFTVGVDVVFGKGEYLPQTFQGRSLLAHELAHVVQQSSSTGHPASDVGVAEESTRKTAPPVVHERYPGVVQRQMPGSSGPASLPLPEAIRILRGHGSTGATLLTTELVNGIRSAEAMFLRERPLDRWAEGLGMAGTVGPGQLGESAITQVDTDFAAQRTAFAAIFGPAPASWQEKASDANWSYFYVAAYLVYSINRAETVFQPATQVITNVQMGILEIGIALYHGAFNMIRELRRRIATSRGIAPGAVTIQMVDEQLRATSATPAESELGRYIGLARGYFNFTFAITAALRQSQRFWINDGKVRIACDARYRSPTASSSTPRGNTYFITLHRFQVVSAHGAVAEGTNPYTTYTYNVGARESAQWLDLPRGEYMFRVEKNEDPYSPDVLEGEGRVETTY